MPTLYSRIRNHALPIALRHLLPVTPRADLIRLGTPYGGWVIPSSLPKSDWTCYCAGVGEDVSFDLALIERYGCQVFAFDFTPRAIAYAEPIAVDNKRFHFFPNGLWSSDTELEFWAPADPAHVSYSAMNLQRTSQSITAPVRSLSSLMGELGHDHIDLLKMDIEGAEFEVIDSLIGNTKVRPSLVCVEFDQPVPARRVRDKSRQLVAEGYDLVAIDGWNYTFSHRK
jgi:FkbM family methyltransferase